MTNGLLLKKYLFIHLNIWVRYSLRWRLGMYIRLVEYIFFFYAFLNHQYVKNENNENNLWNKALIYNWLNWNQFYLNIFSSCITIFWIARKCIYYIDNVPIVCVQNTVNDTMMSYFIYVRCLFMKIFRAIIILYLFHEEYCWLMLQTRGDRCCSM